MFVISVILVIATAIVISRVAHSVHKEVNMPNNITEHIQLSDTIVAPRLSSRQHVASGEVRVGNVWINMSDSTLASLAYQSVGTGMVSIVVKTWVTRDRRMLFVHWFDTTTGLSSRVVIGLGYRSKYETNSVSAEDYSIRFALLLGQYARDYECERMDYLNS
jgi:hypothetical protein